MDLDRVHTLIQRYGLRRATQRELPLLTVSCIVDAYCHGLKQDFGPFYRAFGALGAQGSMETLLNELLIAEETRQFMRRAGDALEREILAPVELHIAAWQKVMDRIRALRDQNPSDYFQRLIMLYPKYLTCIGVYNALWRAIGDGSTMKISEDVVKKIGVGRDAAAKIYRHVEEIIRDVVEKVGAAEHFDGDLLRYCTYRERCAGEDRDRDPAWRNTLAQRRDGYFYLYVEDGDEEFLLTDPKDVAAIREQYYSVDANVREVKGNVAYGGKVRGVVVNFEDGPRPQQLPPNSIIVASMTHPDDLTYIKQAAAIVTDEGGILCHAAIVVRELKIPTIIGTKIGSKIFKNGERVEVDGKMGIVKKYNPCRFEKAMSE